MRKSIGPHLETSLIPIPQSCLTALLLLPVRFLILPAIWLFMHFRRLAR